MVTGSYSSHFQECERQESPTAMASLSTVLTEPDTYVSTKQLNHNMSLMKATQEVVYFYTIQRMHK